MIESSLCAVALSVIGSLAVGILYVLTKEMGGKDE